MATGLLNTFSYSLSKALLFRLFSTLYTRLVIVVCWWVIVFIFAHSTDLLSLLLLLCLFTFGLSQPYRYYFSVFVQINEPENVIFRRYIITESFFFLCLFLLGVEFNLLLIEPVYFLPSYCEWFGWFFEVFFINVLVLNTMNHRT